ncbi:hypothetical protein [Aeromonas veronii]|uniref:hypothetical protein n=1 Tax=Aeromonas veronii TaxID=654 RepID=UPI002B4730BC|nr:hypothetical protein [Aeromonas veronii]
MGKKKHTKVKYDLVKTLRYQAFPPEYEDLTRRLYSKACQGSSHLWGKIPNIDTLRNDEELRKQFYSSANQGMMSAQDDIIDIVLSGEKIDAPKELIIRGIADAIAWQLLGNQLAYARRFFQAIPQPDLYNSNFKSVVFAAKESLKEKPDTVSLISDLTSFIQIGDLLECDPNKGLKIVEVKEGKMNAKIGDFMDFYMHSQCDQALHYFAQQEGEQAIKQLHRMFRQMNRMLHVTSILNTGHGVDPDTNEQIKIPEPFFPMENWDDQLTHTLKKAHDKGWAIDVIDNCLFLGVYASEHMRIGGHIIFNHWFDNAGGTPECPRKRLIDCMYNPLALPIFSRDIPDEYKFDVLFGRKHVCMGICIEKLLEECNKSGYSVRFATNKEQGLLDKTGKRPYKHKGKSVFIGDGVKEVVLMDGIFLRIMFHGQTPMSVIKTMIENFEPPK